MSTTSHLEAGGLLLIADASLPAASLEQVAPLLAQGVAGLPEALGAPSSPRDVVLFDGVLKPEHAQWLHREPPALLLATRERDGGPSQWEARLLGVLLRQGSLLPERAEVVCHPLRGVVDVQLAATAVGMAVEASEGSRVAAGLAADVAHEIAVNALLDAPVDARGAPRYAHRRTEVREVEPEDACELRFAVEDGRIWLEVVDRFGGLRPGPFARALEGWGRKVKVDASGGGAGLGLRRILEHSDAVAVRVVVGRESRVVCVVDLGDARRRAAQPKSLMFCLHEVRVGG
ncbi:hypothetical protein MYSTI_05013 [Myxococcus stipitatus DSM 14675]|uniref:Uncharacterized protein n=1 Tax=Myxococcus stipitatus (strain DSM 14675 / JCM 12634 / Mx s8) TaxID=1278073 RepID=L7UBL9_MYXSD|nr:hypothetical protein [Myxococcus stipitatus]AGC46301.1 hypothetical protein MYSTI_05013 [Myxococcus stipitatus DSM 14675]